MALLAIARAAGRAAPPPELAPFLDPDLCDGFDFPFASPDGTGAYQSKVDGGAYDGWYVATGFGEEYVYGIHTGEDWNGSGGGDTDLGQPVYASARGRVLFAGDAGAPYGNVVQIEHRFLDNGAPARVFTQYDHLAIVTVRAGDKVDRRQPIGTIGKGAGGVFPAHLHFEIRSALMDGYPADYWPSSHGKDAAWVLAHYEKPTAFVKAHRKLLVPACEPVALVALKSAYQMHRLESGAVAASYEIALSQDARGAKRRQGDNRLPEGAYRICQKARGPFPTDDWANVYLGKAWLRISYPNGDDARQAFARGLITRAQLASLLEADRAGVTPDQTTPLGGGIGIHGWHDPEWKDDGPRDLTWGCISMHARDLEEVYEAVPVGTPIVIAP